MSEWSWVIGIAMWAVLAWELAIQRREIRDLGRASAARVRELEDRVEALQSEVSHLEQSVRIRA